MISLLCNQWPRPQKRWGTNLQQGICVNTEFDIIIAVLLSFNVSVDLDHSWTIKLCESLRPFGLLLSLEAGVSFEMGEKKSAYRMKCICTCNFKCFNH